MSEPLVKRLADALRKHEPDNPALQEVGCRYCAGLGAGFIRSLRGVEWYVCYYCGGEGSGVSKAFAKDLEVKRG